MGSTRERGESSAACASVVAGGTGSVSRSASCHQRLAVTVSPIAPTTPAHRHPLWLGALLAPWAAPFTLAFALVATDPQSTFADVVEILAYAFAFGLVPAYAAVLSIGVPWVLWLRARGRLHAWRVVLPAAPMGALVMIGALRALGATLAPLAQGVGGAVLGASVAAAFCLACGIPWRAASR